MNNPFAKLQLPFLKNTVTLILTPGKMLLLGIIALGAVIWFFFLGLLLGRGEYPERAIPEISKMMPQSNGTEIPLTVLTVEPTSEVEQRITEKKAVTKENSTVKQEPDTKKVAINPLIKKQDLQKNSKKIAQEVAKKTTQKISPKTEKKVIIKEASQSEDIFDYVYQVASFKDEKSANAFANKIKKSGIKTRVASSRSGSTLWSRVVVDFRGTPNDTAKLREQLKPFKVDKMVMLKKKAIKK